MPEQDILLLLQDLEKNYIKVFDEWSLASIKFVFFVIIPMRFSFFLFFSSG